MIEVYHAEGTRSPRIVWMPGSMIAAPTAAERDRRLFPQAPGTSLWLCWLRRIGDGLHPRGWGWPEPGDGGIGHRRPRPEVLGGAASGAATTPPTDDLGAPE